MFETSTIIYMGHFLSSWGDRMWFFAIPLFLMDLDPSSLALTAAYGLSLALGVLLFAPIVGDWIDRKKRMYAVTITLAIQNLAVILCAIILIINREYGDYNAKYSLAVKSSAILLGAIAMLASTATGICIQKDWIVVIAAGRPKYLTRLNAMVRRIDLVTKVISPLVCGQIMSVGGLTGGAIFIVAWNSVSMFSEYFLLKLVYKRTPNLAVKGEQVEDVDEAEAILDQAKTTNSIVRGKTEKPKKIKKKKTVFQKMFGFIFVLRDGWKLYIAQSICKAGIGMACLYLTVLGFGYVTTSYAYNQCFSEFTMGIFQGAAAFFGILGTYLFPFLRTRVGLVKAGFLCGCIQLLTLIPCFYSVFAPGSPFFLLPVNQPHTKLNDTAETTNSNFTDDTTTVRIYSALSHPTATNIYSNLSFANVTSSSNLVPTTFADGDSNMSATNFNSISRNFNTFSTTPSFLTSFFTVASSNASADNESSLEPKLLFKCLKGVTPPPSFLSVSLLLGGCVVARAGLWGFDLAVTQLIQENVKETERGIFNGVQTSLSKLMDLIRFVLVLFLPQPKQFGILVFVATFWVTTGYVIYGIFVKESRGKFDGIPKKDQPAKPRDESKA